MYRRLPDIFQPYIWTAEWVCMCIQSCNMTSGTVYIGSRAPRPMNRLPVDNITAPENVNLSSTVGDYIILTVDSWIFFFIYWMIPPRSKTALDPVSCLN